MPEAPRPIRSVACGYSPAQIVGKTPRLFSSARHDAAFFAAMQDNVNRTGSWKGEVWVRRQNGEVFSAWATISAVRGSDGEVTQYVGTLTDISQRKAAEAAIEHLAYYDSLTQLPNRRLLLDRLQHAIAASARTREHGAILFIDLDNFKTLNDTRGHTSAIFCSETSPSVLPPACAKATRWPAWGVTNTWWCSNISAKVWRRH